MVEAKCSDVGGVGERVAGRLHGPRLTRSPHVLIAAPNGNTREGFEIEADDADTGGSRSVALASGGERVWINASQARAVAL